MHLAEPRLQPRGARGAAAIGPCKSVWRLPTPNGPSVQRCTWPSRGREGVDPPPGGDDPRVSPGDTQCPYGRTLLVDTRPPPPRRGCCPGGKPPPRIAAVTPPQGRIDTLSGNRSSPGWSPLITTRSGGRHDLVHRVCAGCTSRSTCRTAVAGDSPSGASSCAEPSRWPAPHRPPLAAPASARNGVSRRLRGGTSADCRARSGSLPRRTAPGFARRGDSPARTGTPLARAGRSTGTRQACAPHSSWVVPPLDTDGACQRIHSHACGGWVCRGARCRAQRRR